MASERKWFQVSANFTADGNAQGRIQVADIAGFFVKSKVRIRATGQEDLLLEVKRAEGSTLLFVGDPNQDMNARTNLSAYTVAQGASVTLFEQEFTRIKIEDITQAVYMREPVCAIRSHLVDKYGLGFDSIVDSNGKRRLAVEGNFVAEVDVDVDVDIDGYYDPVDNPDPDDVGMIAHARALNPNKTNLTQRVTSVTGLNDTTHRSVDVSIHDKNGDGLDSTLIGGQRALKTDVVRTVSPSNVLATGTISSTSAPDNEVIIPVVGQSTVTVTLTGTWTGEIGFQASNDSVPTWNNIIGMKSYGELIGSTTTNQSVIFAIGGWTQVRMYAIALTSGSVTVTMNAGHGQQNMAVYQFTADSLKTEVHGNFDDGTDRTMLLGTNGEVRTLPKGLEVPGLSTTNLLGVGQVYTGTWTKVVDYSMVTFTIFSNVSSASGGLSIQWGPDGSSIDKVENSDLVGGTGRAFALTVRGRYFRIVYTNGGTIQSSFRIATDFHTSGSGIITNPLNQTITDSNFAQLVFAVNAGRNLSGQYIPYRATSVSAIGQNSTITPLGAGLPFTGQWEDVLGFANIAVTVFTDQASANDGLILEYSSNGSDIDDNDFYTVSAGNGLPTTVGVLFRYFRVRYINGAAPQTAFRLTTLYSASAQKPSSHRVADSINGQNDAELVKAVLTAQNPSGDFVNIPIAGFDPDNSRTAGLNPSENYTGTYHDVRGYSSALTFAFADQPLDVKIRWSNDGIVQRPGLLGLQTVAATTIPGFTGFFIYIVTTTTMIDNYYRLEVTNTGLAATTFFEASSWFYDKPFTGSFGGLNSPLSNLSQALLTRSVNAGVDPDEGFKNIRVQGMHSGNTTEDPLPGNSGGSDHIFRGIWFPWQQNYIKLVTDLYSDVPGTLFIDLSELETPVDGDDTGVTTSMQFTYNPAISPLFFRQTPIQSRWVRYRYVNGVAAQSVFTLTGTFTTSDPGVPTQTLSVLPNKTGGAGIIRAVTAIPTADGTGYQEVPVRSTTGNPKQSVEEIHDDILIRPLDTASAFGLPVGPALAVQIDNPTLPNRRVVDVFNEGPVRIAVGHSPSITFDAASIRIPPYSSRTFGLGPGVNLYSIAELLGGTQSTLTRSPASASGTATNPNNVVSSNDSYANITANAQTINATGYTAGSVNALLQVRLGIEGNKQSGQTETVAHLDTVVGESTGIGTVTSASVTGAASMCYIAAISFENTGGALGTVITVTGLGLTWVSVGTAVNGTARRVHVYRAVGTGTTGTVQASFSEVVPNAHIAVARFSNVDQTTPVQAFTTNSGTGTAVTTAGIAGTNKGMSYMAVTKDNTTFTPGAGYTEQSDQVSPTDPLRDGLATETKPLVSTGTETPTGTNSVSVAWAAVSLTLTPMVAINPSVTLSYTLSSIPGATSGTIIFTSGTDGTQFVNITNDRSWVVADIPNVNVIATGLSIGGAAANIDHIFIELIDSTGTPSRVSVWQGGRAVT